MEDNKIWLSSELGLYLKSIRTKKGYSQGYVAKEMGYESNQFISNVERGVCTPSPSVLHKFLKVYEADNPKTIKKILDIQMRYLEAEYRGQSVNHM